MSALLVSLPVLLVGLTTVVLAALVTRALRDDSVVEAVRIEVRRVGDVHRAVRESRAVDPLFDGRPPAAGRRRG